MRTGRRNVILHACVCLIVLSFNSCTKSGTPPKEVPISTHHDIVQIEPHPADLPPPTMALALAFANTDVAWAYEGIPLSLLRTTNGGLTWQRFSLDDGPEREPFGTVYWHRSLHPYFAQPTQGWISSSTGTWRTVDSGLTWTRVFLQQFEMIAFYNEEYGLISFVNGDDEREYWVTSDGADSWQRCPRRYRYRDIGSLEEVRFVSKKIAVADALVLTRGRELIPRIARTEDGGCGWKVVWEGLSGELYRGLYFLDSKRGWMIRDWSPWAGRALLSTSDGGASWTITNPALPFSARLVFFSSPEVGFIMDIEARFYETRDCGSTWTLLREDELNDLTQQASDGFLRWDVGLFLKMLIDNGFSMDQHLWEIR